MKTICVVLITLLLLTNMALSWRMGERLVERFKRGEL
jgi:hypothetical protein